MRHRQPSQAILVADLLALAASLTYLATRPTPSNPGATLPVDAAPSPTSPPTQAVTAAPHTRARAAARTLTKALPVVVSLAGLANRIPDAADLIHHLTRHACPEGAPAAAPRHPPGQAPQGVATDLYDFSSSSLVTDWVTTALGHRYQVLDLQGRSFLLHVQ